MADMILCSSPSSFWKKPIARLGALGLVSLGIPLGFLTITLIAACLSLFWTARWLYEIT
jgi:hypothetical protein